MSRAEQRRLIHDAGARLGTYLRFGEPSMATGDPQPHVR